MKNDGSNQARLFDTGLLLTPALASPHSEGNRDPLFEAVSTKIGVTGYLVGILFMHVVLIGAILACAVLAQSSPLDNPNWLFLHGR
jgi:hypothetical protein